MKWAVGEELTHFAEEKRDAMLQELDFIDRRYSYSTIRAQ